MSSYAVAGFGTEEPLTEDALDIGQSIGGNPYVMSKYRAEEQVLLARGEGVASTIFRLGNLTARASDGLFQRNAEASGMAAQLNAIRALGVYPESMAQVPYDDTAVDRAAQAVRLLAEKWGTGHIWHVMNPHVKTLPQLTDARCIGDAAFAAALAGNSENRDVAILSVYWRMKREGFNTRFDSSRTQKALSALGFAWQ